MAGHDLLQITNRLGILKVERLRHHVAQVAYRRETRVTDTHYEREHA